MGTDMVAFIEYDRIAYDYGQWGAPAGWPATPPPPFDERSGPPESVTGEGGVYTGSKDYLFSGAIAGVRNRTEVPPHFPPRGLPPNLSLAARRHIEAEGGIGNYGSGWLTLAEVNAALDHQRVDRSRLSFETETILFLMANLESRLGVGRVRLVFGFWG